MEWKHVKKAEILNIAVMITVIATAVIAERPVALLVVVSVFGLAEGFGLLSKGNGSTLASSHFNASILPAA